MAQVTTRELFPASASEASIKAERDLRLQAGALSSNHRRLPDQSWELESVWGDRNGSATTSATALKRTKKKTR